MPTRRLSFPFSTSALRSLIWFAAVPVPSWSAAIRRRLSFSLTVYQLKAPAAAASVWAAGVGDSLGAGVGAGPEAATATGVAGAAGAVEATGIRYVRPSIILSGF